MKRAHIIVSGRVQGVYFRDHTKKQAKKLNLKGFVRNLPTGDVEIIVEGKEDQIKELLKYCKIGPDAADVTNAIVEYEPVTNEFSTFEIKY
ncbi:MAG: acylphosphatase [Candidatus Woesearchaeota archaeon]|jgi:acylphosphatase|nr:acylphosphatase [Candidatus Woesearchaeota archaeon]